MAGAAYHNHKVALSMNYSKLQISVTFAKVVTNTVEPLYKDLRNKDTSSIRSLSQLRLFNQEASQVPRVSVIERFHCTAI